MDKKEKQMRFDKDFETAGTNRTDRQGFKIVEALPIFFCCVPFYLSIFAVFSTIVL